MNDKPQIITSPSKAKPIKGNITVFLAGGISKCDDWQSEVIEELKFDENVTFYNPRQKSFDIENFASAVDQITWEYERLEKADIFSMYFCNSESDQPICMYELGRNIVRMQIKHPNDWMNRIVVSIEEGYKRKTDVRMQLMLCAPHLYVNTFAYPESHAMRIRNCILKVREEKNTTFQLEEN